MRSRIALLSWFGFSGAIAIRTLFLDTLFLSTLSFWTRSRTPSRLCCHRSPASGSCSNMLIRRRPLIDPSLLIAPLIAARPPVLLRLLTRNSTTGSEAFWGERRGSRCTSTGGAVRLVREWRPVIAPSDARECGPSSPTDLAHRDSVVAGGRGEGE